jgi:hypothetical protein
VAWHRRASWEARTAKREYKQSEKIAKLEHKLDAQGLKRRIQRDKFGTDRWRVERFKLYLPSLAQLGKSPILTKWTIFAVVSGTTALGSLWALLRGR